ncbi:MAG: nucleotidyltransferase family protein, partial [Lachnospiraceae bacterium]|nr:nucleotidyltransferase family protein [Lachnospiraceae bacterium]MBQ8598488.1 nucleotidyltransferase family protein [Lachnospiraceae bacterium]
ADYVLAVMSGNFVQRGAPALCNKYLRTRMALSCGVDAVIELPALYALSSAEFFASGSISLLNQLGIVDVLAFGSESGEVSQLMQAAELLCDDSLLDSSRISQLLKAGHSYPAARAQALREQNANSLEEMPQDLFASPNNILGIEYCKALRLSESSMKPFTVQRAGHGYHSSDLSEDGASFGSASAIRKALETNITLKSPQQTLGASSAFSSDDSTHLQDIKSHVPNTVFTIMQEAKLAETYLTADDFSALLHYKLLCEQDTGFTGYLDCTPDLSDKIRKHLPDFTTVSDFITQLKSKDLTYTRISRVLFHILLNITYPEWYEAFPHTHRLSTPYARLLGFRKDAQPLLTAIRKNSSVPLISKLADASSYLDACTYKLLEQDIFCSSVYETVRFHKTGMPALNEFRQSPIKIS